MTGRNIPNVSNLSRRDRRLLRKQRRDPARQEAYQQVQATIAGNRGIPVEEVTPEICESEARDMRAVGDHALADKLEEFAFRMRMLERA